MLDHWSQISIPATVARGPVIVSKVVSYLLAYNASDVMDSDNLVAALEFQIQIIALICMVRKPSIKLIVLSKRYGITTEKAQNTIQAATQKGIRTMLHLFLSRLFRTNDRNLHYHCRAHPVFSDTIFATTVFKRGNRYAQVYATDFGWARAFPMSVRSEAHESLLLLFAWDRVLPGCIWNNIREMIQGEFCQKLKDAACHLKQL